MNPVTLYPQELFSLEVILGGCLSRLQGVTG